MYDPELQARFLRSATDALLEGAGALLEASQAWQASVQASLGQPPTTTPRPIAAMPLEPFAAWSWALDLWREPNTASGYLMPSQMASASAFAWPPALSPFNMMSGAMSGAAWPLTNSSWPMLTPSFAAASLTPASDPAAFWSAMVTAYWTLPAISWSLYRGPMTLALVNSGMPYAVAAPTARASVAALNAADAVRLQTIKTFAHYQNEGGRAPAQILAPQPAQPPDRAALREAARLRAVT